MLGQLLHEGDLVDVGEGRDAGEDFFERLCAQRRHAALLGRMFELGAAASFENQLTQTIIETQKLAHGRASIKTRPVTLVTPATDEELAIPAGSRQPSQMLRTRRCAMTQFSADTKL